MRTVYKYPLDGMHEIPNGAKFVHGGTDPNGVPSVWFEVETNNAKSSVDFHVFGTGHTIPPGFVHLRTYPSGQFMWHLYARGLS